MKKLFIPLFALAIISCGNGAKKSNTSESGSAETVQAKENMSQEDLEKEDSKFTTSDLAAMEVCGHVKKIEESSVTIMFDKNGNITNAYNSTDEYLVNHNNGKLSLHCFAAGTSIYTVDTINNRLTSVAGGEGAYQWTNNYIYDDTGELVEIQSVTEDFMEDIKETATQKVETIERDTRGNWTKRKVQNKIESRVIVYHDLSSI